MRILIVAISYNSNEALNRYLNSIEIAMENNSDIQLKIVIGDHSESNPFYLSKDPMFDCKVVRQENIGYLGGAAKLLTQEDVLDNDYVIISNVDVELAEDFFTQLKNKKYDCKIGWIAPMIWSTTEQRNRNPFIVKRYPLCKLRILRFLYKVYFLHKLYTMTLYKRKKNQIVNTAKYIYAGHGSFIILTKSFFQKISSIDYPMFLYGEELYLAELISQNSLEVYYDESLKIKTEDHVSTGKMKSKFYYECNYRSLTYIINRFYKNKL